MPGDTVTNSSPQASFTCAISCGEQTTPSSPLVRARCVKRATCTAGESVMPIALSSAASRLVSTVTPIRSGREVKSARLARAARNMAGPPLQWTLVIHAPRSAAARHAAATVFGISWNLKSKKTRWPRATNSRTIGGPSRVKSSLPILTTAPGIAIRSFKAKASAALAQSSAMMISLGRILNSLRERILSER